MLCCITSPGTPSPTTHPRSSVTDRLDPQVARTRAARITLSLRVSLVYPLSLVSPLGVLSWYQADARCPLERAHRHPLESGPAAHRAADEGRSSTDEVWPEKHVVLRTIDKVPTRVCKDSTGSAAAGNQTRVYVVGPSRLVAACTRCTMARTVPMPRLTKCRAHP